MADLAALQATISAKPRPKRKELLYSTPDRLLHRNIRRPYLLPQHLDTLGSSDRPHCSGNRPSLSEEHCIRGRHGLPHHLVPSVHSFHEDFPRLTIVAGWGAALWAIAGLVRAITT